jgi:hypothetical protein
MNVGSNLDLETRERPSRASRPYVGTRDILFLFGEEGHERHMNSKLIWFGWEQRIDLILMYAYQPAPGEKRRRGSGNVTAGSQQKRVFT